MRLIQFWKLDFATFLTAGFQGGVLQAEFNFSGRVDLTLPEKLNSGWRALSRKTASKKLQSRGKVWVALFALLSLTGCRRYYVEVAEQIVNAQSLASAHVGSPDPRLCHPPCGRRLIMSWQIPSEIFDQHPRIELDVMFWNYTQERFVFSMDARRGYVLYALVGEEFIEKKGILSYKAQLVTESGEVYRSWKQQLWVDLIHVDAGSSEPSRSLPSSDKGL